MKTLTKQIASASPVLLLFSICFSHIHQGTPAVDGVRYVGIAGHILDSGNWLHLYDARTESLYVNKPPLLFWITALAFQLFGYSTFVAKAPAVLLGFFGTIFFWHTVEKFFGRRIGFFSFVSLVGCRFFIKDVLDISFEGIVILASALLLHASLLLLTDNEQHHKTRPWLYVALGVFLLIQSKIPYLGLIAFPVVATFWQRKILFDLFANKRLWFALAPSAIVLLAWLIITHAGYAAGAADNQLFEPFRKSNGYFSNLRQWPFSLFVTFAPATELALWFLYQRFYKKNQKIQQTQYDTFLLLWILPILPIVLTAGCRPRYILVPMMALFIFAGRAWDHLLRNHDIQKWHRPMLGLALALFIGAQSGLLTLHRADALILAMKNNPTLLNEINSFCVATHTSNKLREEQINTKILISLEFGRPYADIKIFSSDHAWQNGEIVLANDTCAEKLSASPSTVEIIARYHKAALFKF